MAKQSRKNKWRRPGGTDPVIMALSILTVVLLSAWGGLHLKASQDQQLAAAAGSSGNGFMLMPEDVLMTPPPRDVSTEPDETETAAPTPVPTQEPAASGGTGTGTGTGTTQAGGGSAQAPVQTEQPPKATPVPQQNSSTESAADKQAKLVEKYKNEIIQVQLACTSKLNDLRLKGEAGISKLDKSNTDAVDTFYANFVEDMTASQTSCEQSFMSKLTGAQKEGVPSATVSEWEGTFRSIMAKLQSEFEAALKEYMMQ